MGERQIRLRYPGRCTLCLCDVPAGTEALWDSDRRSVTCIQCAWNIAGPIPAGVAGASALAKAERLRQQQSERHRQAVAKEPIIGRVAVAFAKEPTAGASWAKGAVGERKVGELLDRHLASGVLSLHDRRLPRSRANIDHIAVTAAGVWVIDAKRYKGLVTQVDKGTPFRPDRRLTVGGRDRTRLASGVVRQVAHVQQALVEIGAHRVPLHGALCFVDGDFHLLQRPFLIEGVLVVWPRALRKRLLRPGWLNAEQRKALHRHLARSFPPAA